MSQDLGDNKDSINGSQISTHHNKKTIKLLGELRKARCIVDGRLDGMYGTWPNDDKNAFVTPSENISCSFACKCYGILGLNCKRYFVTDEGRLDEGIILLGV